jgi:hypothetical protein
MQIFQKANTRFARFARFTRLALLVRCAGLARCARLARTGSIPNHFATSLRTRTLYRAHDVNRAHIRAVTHITLAFDRYTISPFFMFWFMFWPRYKHSYATFTLTHRSHTTGHPTYCATCATHRHRYHTRTLYTRATKQRVFFRRFAVTSFLQPTHPEPTT